MRNRVLGLQLPSTGQLNALLRLMLVIMSTWRVGKENHRLLHGMAWNRISLTLSGYDAWSLRSTCR